MTKDEAVVEIPVEVPGGPERYEALPGPITLLVEGLTWDEFKKWRALNEPQHPSPR